MDSKTSDRALIQRVAELARLAIDEDQQEAVAGQLSNILSFVDQLQAAQLDESTPPFFGALEPTSMEENSVRVDQVVSSRQREDMLANAPKSDGEFYQVPAVFDDKSE